MPSDSNEQANNTVAGIDGKINEALFSLVAVDFGQRVEECVKFAVRFLRDVMSELGEGNFVGHGNKEVQTTSTYQSG